MKRYVLPIVFVVAFGLLPRVSWAQVILYGCTASLTATPATARLVDINPMTGLASNPRDIGIGFMAGIAVQPLTGQLFGLTSFASTPANSLVRIDPMTGIPVVVGTTGFSTIVEGDLAFSPVSGFLYGLQEVGSTANLRMLFRIDPLTGTATAVGNLPIMADYSAMSFDSTGSLFVIDTGFSTNSVLLRIDENSGNILDTKMLNVNLGAATGLTFDPISGTAFVADGGEDGTNTLYTLNTVIGSLNPIGTIGNQNGIAGLSFSVVPEPSSLFLVGGGALAFWRWRRRCKVVTLAD
jgi:DNA-binding beta-propeller fold protein YncE